MSASIIFSFALKKSIIKPLSLLKDAVRQVESTGNFSINTRILANDEVGETILAFNGLLQSLQSAISEINMVMSELAASNFTKNITAELRGDLDIMKSNTNTSIEQLRRTIQQIARAIKEMTIAVSESTINVEKASLNARETTASIEDGQQELGVLKEEIELIAQESEKISNIISVISEIARKTNLLALNAAVEAARAGEHGASFAVVASEVRTLAINSAESATQISALIEASVDLIAKGVETSEKVSGRMQKVVESVIQTDNNLQHISASMEEQMATIQHVDAQVEQFKV